MLSFKCVSSVKRLVVSCVVPFDVLTVVAVRVFMQSYWLKMSGVAYMWSKLFIFSLWLIKSPFPNVCPNLQECEHNLKILYWSALSVLVFCLKEFTVQSFWKSIFCDLKAMRTMAWPFCLLDACVLNLSCFPRCSATANTKIPTDNTHLWLGDLMVLMGKTRAGNIGADCFVFFCCCFFFFFP